LKRAIRSFVKSNAEALPVLLGLGIGLWQASIVPRACAGERLFSGNAGLLIFMSSASIRRRQEEEMIAAIYARESKHL